MRQARSKVWQLRQELKGEAKKGKKKGKKENRNRISKMKLRQKGRKKITKTENEKCLTGQRYLLPCFE